MSFAHEVEFVGITGVSLLGILVGSFLNVVIGRVPEGRSVVHPSSACPRCDHKIGHRDNIPILSWTLLRGKCRNCSLPISARYPLIEALTGALFGLTAWRLGWTPELPAVLLFVAGGIALSAIDIEHFRLPNEAVYPQLGLVGAALVVAAAVSLSWSRLVWVVAGAVVSAGLLFTIVFLTRGRGMGMGDYDWRSCSARSPAGTGRAALRSACSSASCSARSGR